MSVKYKLLKYHGHFSTRSEYRAVTIENQVVGIDRIGRSIQGAQRHLRMPMSLPLLLH